MIQIDDAGSGSFVGGTCIGFYRPETNEYYFDIIPVELYDKNNFRKKLYLKEVTHIAEKAFQCLNVPRHETVEICRGYMFEDLRQWLSSHHFFWYNTQITGKIQEIVEKNFALYTIYLGLPDTYIRYTRYPFHFHKLLRWVLADFENRIILCKTGWKCWKKLEGIRPVVTEDILRSNHQFCLKCGKILRKSQPVTTLYFESNRENYIFLHTECYTTQEL